MTPPASRHRASPRRRRPSTCPAPSPASPCGRSARGACRRARRGHDCRLACASRVARRTSAPPRGRRARGRPRICFRVDPVAEVLDVPGVQHLLVLVTDGHAEDRLAEIDGLADERQAPVAHDGLRRPRGRRQNPASLELFERGVAALRILPGVRRRQQNFWSRMRWSSSSSFVSLSDVWSTSTWSPGRARFLASMISLRKIGGTSVVSASHLRRMGGSKNVVTTAVMRSRGSLARTKALVSW